MSKKSIPENGIYDARELGTPRMLVLGIQHMFAMFGATVLVPVLTGLSVSATLLFAGLGTLLFHLLAKGKGPIVKERRMTQYWQLDEEPLESRKYWDEALKYIGEEVKEQDIWMKDQANKLNVDKKK